MVNYGSGRHGSRTVSASTTDTRQYHEYTDLTVESGNVLTVPANTRILVSGTLTVEGVVEAKPDDRNATGASAATGNVRGGHGGGHLEVIAASVSGGGTISADGENAPDVSDYTNSSGGNGNNGTAYEYQRVLSGNDPKSGSSGGSSGGTVSANTNTPPSTQSVLGLRQLKETIEDDLSGSFVSEAPYDGFIAGSGASGGGGGDIFIDTTDGDGNPDDGSVSGGTGGAGGSLMGLGGEGGLGGGGDNKTGDAGGDTLHGGTGGAGGGAGGVIVYVTENGSSTITLQATGGDGSRGTRSYFEYDSTYYDDGSGGGGGGGGGGFVLTFSDAVPYFDVRGGASGPNGGGTEGSVNGESGNPGTEGHVETYSPSFIDQ